MPETLNEESLSRLQADLADPTQHVFLVAAPSDDYAWSVAKARAREEFGPQCYRLDSVDELTAWLRPQVSGWPQGFPWGGEGLCGLCFGYRKRSVIALTRSQCRDPYSVEDALAHAQQLTR